MKQFHANDTYDIVNEDGTLELGISSQMMRFEAKSHNRRRDNNVQQNHKKDSIIFLGGTNGGSWGWQQRVAIPILTGFGVDHFDPQSVRDHEDASIKTLVMRARSRVLLYVIESDRHGAAEMIDAADAISRGERVSLAIVNIREGEFLGSRLYEDSRRDSEPISKLTELEMNRARGYLASVASRWGVHVYSTASDAVIDAVRLLEESTSSSSENNNKKNKKKPFSGPLQELRRWRKRQRRLRKEKNMKHSGGDVELVKGTLEDDEEEDTFDSKLPSAALIARLQSKLRAQAYGADPTRPFGKSTRAVFSRLDTNHDRELSRDEFVAGVRRVCKLQKEEASALFDAVDFNSDEHVTPNEFVTFVDQWVVKRGSSSTGSHDDGFPVEKPWHRVLCKQEKDTVKSLKEENRRLRSELEALDDGFFDDVEELKYRYSNAVKRLTELRREDRIGGMFVCMFSVLCLFYYFCCC